MTWTKTLSVNIYFAAASLNTSPTASLEALDTQTLLLTFSSWSNASKRPVSHCSKTGGVIIQRHKLDPKALENGNKTPFYARILLHSTQEIQRVFIWRKSR